MDDKNLTLKLIEEKEECIEVMLKNPTSVVGPCYRGINKQIGQLCLQAGQELKGIYYLSESHAPTLRQQAVIKYDYKEDIIQNPARTSSNLPVAHGIHKKYVEFGNNCYKGAEGLLSRLRDMPKEWTVVQLTKQASSKGMFWVPPKDSKMENLNIVRLPCGTSLKDKIPLWVLVEPPKSSEGMPTMFDLMDESIKKHIRVKNTTDKEIRARRKLAAENIKAVTEELSSNYLRAWRCLLLGTLVNAKDQNNVNSCIDTVLCSPNHKKYKIDSRSRDLLYQVADGAVHLTVAEIKSAVACIVTCKHLYKDLVEAIKVFKENNSFLFVARRNPVILIIEEELDALPWEMIPILKKHPVSRIPSIHFLHALYHEHKDHIVDGCRQVSKLDLGFYIINPDLDLKEMEARLTRFIEKRIPEWKGLKGVSPSEDEFCSALVKNSVLLYCGHHNGTHFLRPDDVACLRVIALPMLFGCASVALVEVGGDTQPTGVPDKYIMAGSACVMGMLWTVTSDDTDCMTVMMLNSWLPGQPIDLKGFRKSGDMFTAPKEPELLRLMRYAREVANLYSNAAALVVRGIPVRMVDS